MNSSATHSEPATLGTQGPGAAFPSPMAPAFLFAGVLVVYMVLRWNAPVGGWPTQSDMRLKIAGGGIGALLLLSSSVSLELACRAARRLHAKSAQSGLWLTLGLGMGFVGLQALEYRSRWLHHLIPAAVGGGLHGGADLIYLSAVHHRLAHIAAEINTATVVQNQLDDQLQRLPDARRADPSRMQAELTRLQRDTSARAERLAIVNRLLSSEVKWTEQVVGLSGDSPTQRMAMIALAQDIYPLAVYAPIHERYRQQESQTLAQSLGDLNQKLAAAKAAVATHGESLRPLQTLVALLKAEQRQLSERLKNLPQGPDCEEPADEPEGVVDPERLVLQANLAEVQQRLNEALAKLTDSATMLTEAQDAASQWSQEVASLRARQAMIADVDRMPGGINREHAFLRLPVSIPGGLKWASTYFLLTGVHGFCLLIGLMAMVFILRKRSPSALAKVESRIRSYWHCSVIVWLILFMLIYVS